jgi:hypothetical protein
MSVLSVTPIHLRKVGKQATMKDPNCHSYITLHNSDETYYQYYTRILYLPAKCFCNMHLCIIKTWSKTFT